jgi:hypothetical protein
MNSFINILLLIITIPTLFFSVFVGFDLPVEILHTTAAQLPYKFLIFLSLGMLLLIISVRRSIRRWMGIRMVNQTTRFKWTGQISKKRKQRVIVYTILESVIMFSLSVGYVALSKEAWFPASVMMFFGIEGILFLLVNAKSRFRVGLSSKAILTADREVILLYLEGLRKVSISQQSLYFDYIEELQLSFPTDCIEDAERNEFFEQLKKSVNRDKVLFRVTD